MKNKVHVKKGDTVLVLTGKDRTKKGKVVDVLPKKNRVLVEGINIVKKHKKPRSANQQGGIIEQENFIDASNVMLICDSCKKPTKPMKVIDENGTKKRVCRKCEDVIETIRDQSADV